MLSRPNTNEKDTRIQNLEFLFDYFASDSDSALTSVTFDRGYCISVSYGTDENTIIIDMPHVVSKPTRIYYVLVSKVCTYPGKL
jgi:hypothetical protein